MNKDSPNSCGCNGGSAAQSGCAKTGAAAQTTVFRVSTMDCRNEEGLVRRTLGGRPGVERLEFDLANRRLTVLHSQGSPQDLEQVLASIGMRATAQAAGSAEPALDAASADPPPSDGPGE